jgi:hypothetical protein
MAGERKGKTYEAFVHLALGSLASRGDLAGTVYWNETPQGMTIDPDFTIGKSVDSPTTLLLVSHGGSTKESNRKYWRNVGELCEAKVRLKTQPRVYTVVFDAVIKDDIKKLEQSSFDGCLVVADRPYGAELLRWVEDHQESLPGNGVKKAEAIAKMIADGRKSHPGPLLKQLSADIRKLLGGFRKELGALWTMERSRTAGRLPKARRTFVRRGLGKLLVFESVDLAFRLYSGKAVPLAEVPGYVFDLGLATRSIAGAKGADEEIRNAIALLGEQAIRPILRSAPHAEMAAWLTSLRNINHLVAIGAYVVDEFASLCDPAELARRLFALHSDPHALIVGARVPAAWPPGTVWLLEYLVELLKHEGGSATSFGYARLAQEAAKLDRMPAAGDRAYRIVLPDWIHRRGREKMMPDFIRGIAKVIAGHLSAIGLGRAKQAASSIASEIQNHILETKLLQYRGFDPLESLIVAAIGGGTEERIQGCFAELAELSGQAGQTQLFRKSKTLVNWQFASDEGKSHKKKELCGRAVSLRYAWSGSRRSFEPREGVDRLLLVVDGTWNQEDLDALSRAGWDIFYPDEMGELLKAVV